MKPGDRYAAWAALTLFAIVMTGAPADADDEPTSEPTAKCDGTTVAIVLRCNFGIGFTASQNLGSVVVDDIGHTRLDDGRLLAVSSKLNNLSLDAVFEAHAYPWCNNRCGVFATVGHSLDEGDSSFYSLGAGLMRGFEIDSRRALNLGIGVSVRPDVQRINQAFVADYIGPGTYIVDETFASRIEDGSINLLQRRASWNVTFVMSVSPFAPKE